PDPAADAERRDGIGGLRIERIAVETCVLLRAEHERLRPGAETFASRAHVESALADRCALLFRVTVQLARDEPAVLVLDPDRRPRRIDQRRGRLDDALQDVFETRGRGELAAELEQ